MDAEGLRKALSATVAEAKKCQNSVVSMASITTGVEAAQSVINQLQGAFSNLTKAYSIQMEAETKLEVVMRQLQGLRRQNPGGPACQAQGEAPGEIRDAVENAPICATVNG